MKYLLCIIILWTITLQAGEEKVPANGNVPDDISQFYQQLDKDDDEDETPGITTNAAVAFEVDPDKIEVRNKTRFCLTTKPL